MNRLSRMTFLSSYCAHPLATDALTEMLPICSRAKQLITNRSPVSEAQNANALACPFRSFSEGGTHPSYRSCPLIGLFVSLHSQKFSMSLAIGYQPNLTHARVPKPPLARTRGMRAGLPSKNPKFVFR